MPEEVMPAFSMKRTEEPLSLEKLKKMIKPKPFLIGLTLIFMILFILTIPQSMSAPLVFLKNIEIGSIEFVNTLGLLMDLSLVILFSGLYLSMLAIMSSIVNFKFSEITGIVVATSVLALLVWGVPGLFILSLIYYCWEIREFIEKMRHSDPAMASAIPMTMTFVIIGLLGGLWAARGQLYFEPEGLEFARGFGRVWLNCETSETVKDCLKDTAEIRIGYSLLVKDCNDLSGENRISCIQRVESTKNDAYEILLSQFEEMGDVDHTVGEYTTIVLARYLNNWVGLLPNESKFILGLIIFALITLVGFVFEIFVPILTGLLMQIFTGYEIIRQYERDEKAKHYVVLE